MKQLPITQALSAMIQAAVGTDVDTSRLAVFETIMLNTKPLPGKRGSLFERAVVEPITLKEMVDSINSPNGHLPLIADHELFGSPKGRLFHAGLDYENDALTMRGLFYLDETEGATTAKLNAGSLDEVSVAFLSQQFNCSQCGWDFFGSASTPDNIYERTCGNGHQIGANDVHGEMVGLNQFIETSLVSRGAADTPKIVGKSQSKLAPANVQLLAAKGFEVDDLVVQASINMKEDENMDLKDAIAQITTLSVTNGGLTVEKSAAEARATAAEAKIVTLSAEKTTLETQVAALTVEKTELSARPEAIVATERDEAVAFLQAQVDHLLVASGKPKMEGTGILTKVAELKAKVTELTGGLTSILPVGGKSAPAGDAGDTVTLSYKPVDAFGVRGARRA